MRSIERPGLALAAALWLAGCSALQGPAPTGTEAPVAIADPAPVTPVAVAVPAVAASATAPVPAAAAAPRPQALTPAAQQAHDQALQALRAGRHADAERLLRPLAAALPDLAGVQANLGLALRGLGRQADSLAALQRAAELSPNNAAIHNELGIALRQTGRFPAAQRAYERALALQPGHAAAHLNLAILLDLYQGDATGALAHYERYQALAGGDATVAKWVLDLKNRKPLTTAMKDKP